MKKSLQELLHTLLTFFVMGAMAMLGVRAVQHLIDPPEERIVICFQIESGQCQQVTFKDKE